MSWLSNLFGGVEASKQSQSAEPVLYEGYRIIPEPMNEEGQYRLAGWIELDVDGEIRKHQFIRADLFRSRDEAEGATVIKAKQLIDQMGQRLFD
ncbi:MAG: HlyU family transcriptional regulator [Pseudomonadota bacterium]